MTSNQIFGKWQWLAQNWTVVNTSIVFTFSFDHGIVILYTISSPWWIDDCTGSKAKSIQTNARGNSWYITDKYVISINIFSWKVDSNKNEIYAMYLQQFWKFLLT